MDGQTDPHLTFLNDQVRIAHFDDCASLRYETEVNLIALATIVVVVILGILSLVGLCIYKHKNRSTDDELDLVDNMQQPSPTRPYNLTTPEQRSEFHRRQPSIHLDMVHYVVPAPTTETNPQPGSNDKEPSKKKSSSRDEYDSSKDLKLYVSTSTGLKRVADKTNSKNSNNKSVQFQNGDGHDSVDEEELPPPPLPRKPQIQDPMHSSKKGGFLEQEPCSSPTTSESTNSSISSSDRSLGAIPKKRPITTTDVSQNGRGRRHRADLDYDEKCRRAAATMGSSSSPISSSSSSTGTSVSR